MKLVSSKIWKRWDQISSSFTRPNLDMVFKVAQEHSL